MIEEQSIPRVIDDHEGVVRLAQSIRSGPLAVDTEADSYHHYREKVCLVQVSFGDDTAVVDALAGLDLEPLRPVLESPGVPKILHGADYDLRLLDRDLGLRIVGLFDTMVAARLVGERACGLAALLESRLGVRLDKRHQLADWSRRPLPEALLRYAAEDTRHLVALHRILEDRLVELGRLEWAREEFRRLEGVRGSVAPEDPEAYRDVKGAARLGRRGLAVLRELFAWRRETAQRRDVPPYRVAMDSTLIALAEHPPETVRDLSRAGGAIRALSRDESAEEIVARARRALETRPAEWPERRSRSRGGVPGPAAARVRLLRDRRDRLAARLALEPSILATRATLEAIAMHLDDGRDWRTAPGVRRWQIDLLEEVVS